MYAPPAPRDSRQFGEMGFRLRLPKFIRKMKPLKVLGKAAKIAAPFIPGVGVVGAAAISAGGAVLQKGKKARLFKDVLKSAAVGGAGRFAVKKILPKAFTFAKKEAGSISRLLHPQPRIPQAPDVTPPSQEELDAAAAASREQISPVEQAVAAALPSVFPRQLPPIPGAVPTSDATATDTATAATADQEGGTPPTEPAGMSSGAKTALMLGLGVVGFMAMSPKGRR